MRDERRQSGKAQIKLEVKRSAELWLYSFADMYMIIAVLFIATTALYAKKNREVAASAKTLPVTEFRQLAPTAARGASVASITVAIEFKPGSSEITDEAAQQLAEFLPLISEIKSGVIDVEGYADTRGLASESKHGSNLELSSMRAVEVAEWFVKQGISESRIRTTGFGRAHKFATGEKGAMSDRRVVVKFFSAGSS